MVFDDSFLVWQLAIVLGYIHQLPRVISLLIQIIVIR